VCDGNRVEPPFEYAPPPPIPIVQPDWNALFAALNDEVDLKQEGGEDGGNVQSIAAEETVSAEEIFYQWLDNCGLVFLFERFKAERIASMRHVHMWTDQLLALVPVHSPVHRTLLLGYVEQGYSIQDIVDTILKRRRDSR